MKKTENMDTKVVSLVVLYSLGSSTMLVLNKAATRVVPDTSVLLFFQLFSTVLLAGAMRATGQTTLDMRPPRATCIAYASVAVVFFMTLYANMKILQHAGVNAFIVIRSSTPVAVAILDYILLGRSLPNLRSITSITITIVCCYLYVSMKPKDDQAPMEWTWDCTVWSAGWYAMFVFDQIFIKGIVTKYPCNGWERTMYQNIFATLFAAAVILANPPDVIVTHDHVRGDTMAWTLVAASCVCGGVLSFASLSLRGAVAATTFTVLGVGCKMFSILLNELLVQATRDPARLALVSLAVLASAAYQQAPQRSPREDKALSV